MHLYAIVRGRPSLVRRFKENCEDVFLPFGKAEDGSDLFVQLIPRKVELVEFVFPEKYLPEVLKTVTDWEEIPKAKTGYINKDLAASALRKVIGLKNIPNIDLKKYKKLGCRAGEKVSVPWVACSPIGIKEDAFINGHEQL